MAHRLIASTRLNVYILLIYLFTFLCHLREYALYTQLRNLRHSKGLGQLMGVAHNRMHVRTLQTSRKKAACSLHRNWN